MKQADRETELDFFHRVTDRYSRLGGVYPQEEQIETYARGLTAVVRTEVTREIAKCPEGYATLPDVA